MIPDILLRKKMYFISLVLIANFSRLQAHEHTTQMEVNKEDILTISSNSITFEAQASNEKTYEAGLSCFSKRQTSSGHEHGQIRVLKSESHVGASKVIPYDQCLNIKKDMEDGRIKLLLSWNQEDFEDFISTRLAFNIIEGL